MTTLPTHPYESYTNRTENGQTVYIFGAGASRGEGESVPINQNLLGSAISSKNEVTDDIRNNIRRFVKDLYHFEAVNKKKLPTFEEVFTYIDLALEREKYFKGWGRSSLIELRRDLLLAACTALTKALPPRPRVHNQFVKNLFGRSHVSNRNTSFISFNYDIMLDTSLVPLQDDHRGDIDYGFYFRSYDILYKEPRKRWDPPRRGKELFLLKPHGSFNWTWCPVCGFSRINHEENIALDALSDDVECNKCHGKVEAMLIPPAWLKSYKNFNIANIWSISEFLISQAELIVFVGYSFSDVDLEFKFVLRRSLQRMKEPPNVIVVTKTQKKMTPTLRRYESFFPKVKFFKSGFEEFAKEPAHAVSS